MKTVKEMSERMGVSARTLRYYDQIGLLKPAKVSDAGYRYYDDAQIRLLNWIVLYREMAFSLKEIDELLNADDTQRNAILRSHVEKMEHAKEKLENRILIARGIEMLGIKTMRLDDFAWEKIDDYVAQTKVQWSNTDAQRELEEKNQNRSEEDERVLEDRIVALFAELGQMRDLDADDKKVQAWVQTFRDFITENCYTCTAQMLKGLGKMCAGGGNFTEKIDAVGGAGTGAFACCAIERYCRNN